VLSLFEQEHSDTPFVVSPVRVGFSERSRHTRVDERDERGIWFLAQATVARDHAPVGAFGIPRALRLSKRAQFVFVIQVRYTVPHCDEREAFVRLVLGVARLVVV
jgi:hypothetical protein